MGKGEVLYERITVTVQYISRSGEVECGCELDEELTTTGTERMGVGKGTGGSKREEE